MERDRFADPIAERLATGWREKRQEIATLVERAADLAQELREKSLPFVLCHTDLHAGNVLLGADGELAIVDWDDPILAPKERDLMFFGAGVGAIWDTAREETLFYQGYGPVEIDLTALAYYRYERIVADFASYGEQIFEAQGGVEDRENGVRKVMGNSSLAASSISPTGRISASPERSRRRSLISFTRVNLPRFLEVKEIEKVREIGVNWARDGDIRFVALNPVIQGEASCYAKLTCRQPATLPTLRQEVAPEHMLQRVRHHDDALFFPTLPLASTSST